MAYVPVVGWARLWAIVKPATNRLLRRGAWYPVVDDSANGKVVVGVRKRRVSVPRRFLEVRDSRPTRFTVVNRVAKDPNPVHGTALDPGMSYVVCPNCGNRIRVLGLPKVVACGECEHRGEVAWWETG